MRFSDQTETIDLDTSLGTIRGHVYTTSSGKRIGRFLGIPYAQQPVGNLRFVPPQPLEVPLGTEDAPFEALKVGPAPPQNQALTLRSQLPTGEGCLYLNISCPLDDIDEPKPVLFSIQSGSYYAFSGNELSYDVTHFAEIHDAVGVSVTFRSGLLGFLSMPPVIEDNLGLKDQQLALKWVHQHIKSFGGDTSQITLYGCSAGAVSIHLHLLNEESSALFHRVILSSGCINDMWGLAKEETRDTRTQNVLKRLQIPSHLNKVEILQKLQSLDVSVFENFQESNDDIWKHLPHAVDTFRDKKDNRLPIDRKPILIGMTAEEANLFIEIFFPRDSGDSSGPSWRSYFGDYLGEVYMYGPIREFIAEVMEKGGENYPLFAYLFDYETKTRDDEGFPGSIFRPWFGKFHCLDSIFFLGNCCENSRVLPEVTKDDILVNGAIAAMVQMFMTQKVEKIDLPRYRADTKIVTRITKNGASIDRCEFQFSDPNNDSFIYFKLMFAALLMKFFPNKY